MNSGLKAPQTWSPFRLRGELDMASVKECRVQLWAYAATTEGEVVCDCTDLEFLDSSGIAMLIDVERELARLGRRMRLINVIGSPRVCLDACGLTEHFGIVDDAPVVLTPPAIVMLRHLVRHTVIDAHGDGTGLSGVVTRDALHELHAAGYVNAVKMPNGQPATFVITAAGRRKAARLEPGSQAL